MVKVIIEYKVKDIKKAGEILLQVRSQASYYEGFVRSEILVNESDPSQIAVEKTWDKIEHWRAWEKSALRQSLIGDVKALLLEEPRVRIYQIMPTLISWVG